MASLDEIREERLKKLELLAQAQMETYPSRSERTLEIKQVINTFPELLESQTEFVAAGRIMSLRLAGALCFIDIYDGTGRLQALLKKDTIDTDLYQLFVDTVDVGDFVEVKAKAFVTKREADAMLASSWRMLSKSLRPIPTEHFGLKDEEERLRRRYLDILVNTEIRDMFVRKASFWRAARSFMLEQGFMEVETPSLELTTGGAEAAPFATHHNDYDLDVFLRISAGELWQKRLMAAGFPKTFEVARVYRNEGSSPNHLQEFTNIEFYWAYANYKQGMELVKEMVRTIAKQVYGTTKFTSRDHTYDVADQWIEVDYVDEIKKQTGVDIENTNLEEIKKRLEELGVSYEGENLERLTDTLWKFCRKHIAGPGFLINHPILVSPLAKRNADRPNRAERFQILLGGAELGTGYSELNDPIDQLARFEEQKALLEAGDDEAMMPDYEFVEMLEYGMPPTVGFGFGERLFSFFENKPIRETTLFPLMRPIENYSEAPGDTAGEEDDTDSNSMQVKASHKLSRREFGSSDNSGNVLTRQETLRLLFDWVKNDGLRLHNAQVGHLMAAWAKDKLSLSESEVEKWWVAGTLHDADWEKSPDQHCQTIIEHLESLNQDPDILHAIAAHGPRYFGYEPKTDMQKMIYVFDELSGFIHACSLVRGGYEGMKVKSVMKNLKKARFAAQISRDDIADAIERIDFTLDEIIQFIIDNQPQVLDTE